MSRPPLANSGSGSPHQQQSLFPVANNQHSNNNNNSQSQPMVGRNNSSGVLSAGDRDSSVALGDDRRSEVSGAGYSAYSGHRADTETGQANYHMRLVRFYQRYNPEKIPRVAEFLEAYQGDEEELFKTLSQKYGPEPEPSVISLGSRSEATTNRQIGVATVPKVVSPVEGNCDRETPYYPSQRTIMESDLCNLLATKKTTHQDLVPVFVGYLSAHPTAAWNGMTYITNVPVPIDEESRFLGHLWAGSLSNTKTIVHDKVAFTRTVFHCGESCSSSHWMHERWRLTLIRGDHTQDTLYRVLWDPVLSPAAAAELLKAAPNAVEQDRNSFFSFFRRQGSEKSIKGSNAQAPPPPPLAKSVPSSGFSSRSQQHAASQQQQNQQNNYHTGPQQLPGSSASQHGATSHHNLPAYPPPMTLSPPTANNNNNSAPHQPTQPNTNIPAPLQPQQPNNTSNTTRAPSPAGIIPTNNAPTHQSQNQPQQVTSTPHQQQQQQPHQHHHQPQQPQLVSTVDSLVNLVQGLEGRLTERLNDLDRRLQAVEGDIVYLKEVSEQQQIEQLPEPWLDDGGTSHQGSSLNAGRAHKKIKKEVSQKEKAQALQRHRRKQHRKRMEQERNRLAGNNEGDGGGDADEHDGTETVLTSSVGTSLGTSGYR